jgi:hypothetical protein
MTGGGGVTIPPQCGIIVIRGFRAVLAAPDQKGHSETENSAAGPLRDSPACMMETFVILSMPYRRVAAIAVLSAGILTLPGVLLAQSSLRDMSRVSTSGNYLAARHASTQRDAAAAAAYYRAALRADPKNSELLDRAFVSVLAEGDI